MSLPQFNLPQLSVTPLCAVKNPRRKSQFHVSGKKASVPYPQQLTASNTRQEKRPISLATLQSNVDVDRRVVYPPINQRASNHEMHSTMTHGRKVQLTPIAAVSQPKLKLPLLPVPVPAPAHNPEDLIVGTKINIKKIAGRKDRRKRAPPRMSAIAPGLGQTPVRSAMPACLPTLGPNSTTVRVKSSKDMGDISTKKQPVKAFAVVGKRCSAQPVSSTANRSAQPVVSPHNAMLATSDCMFLCAIRETSTGVVQRKKLAQARPFIGYNAQRIVPRRVLYGDSASSGALNLYGKSVVSMSDVLYSQAPLKASPSYTPCQSVSSTPEHQLELPNADDVPMEADGEVVLDLANPDYVYQQASADEMESPKLDFVPTESGVYIIDGAAKVIM